MNSLMSPSKIRWAVQEVLYERVNYAVWRAVHDAVYDAMCRAVYETMSWAVLGVVRVNETLHPNVDKFINETEQNWDVA